MAETKTQKNTKTIRLYKDNEKYKDDVQVIVNGKVFIIHRGVDVEVPDFVSEVLENSQKQSQYAIEVSDSTGKRE